MLVSKDGLFQDSFSIAEQRAIVATLEELSEETKRLESIYRHKLTALDELKMTLLHQAFSGQL